MALSNVSDYQLCVNQLLWWIDNVAGGIDRDRLPVATGMLRADFETIANAYFQQTYDGNGKQNDSTGGYKKTRNARPTASELAPTGHGANKTTFRDGR